MANRARFMDERMAFDRVEGDMTDAGKSEPGLNGPAHRGDEFVPGIPVKRLISYKYNEGDILQEVQAYIDSTYGQHYVGNGEVQTVDVWQSLGIAAESCQSNVIKYAMRYGKKGGSNKKDLLKIIHYTILWWHYTQLKE